LKPGTDAVHAERAIKTDRPAFPQAVWFFGSIPARGGSSYCEAAARIDGQP
jgi:hypothetical protein